ncbi:hypothetical protein AAHE18_14G125000 [Arachis hypogaea]
MDGLGHAGLEDENMEAALEEVLDSEREREDVIELVLRLVEEVVMEHLQRLGHCDQIWRGDELRWRRQRRRRGELSLFCSSLRSPQPTALSPRPNCALSASHLLDQKQNKRQNLPGKMTQR